MVRLLVVIDETVQSAVALDQAIDLANAIAGSELVLLSVLAEPSAWQRKRSSALDRSDIAHSILKRAESRAAASGMQVKSLVAVGEKADLVAKIADQENCSHIFLAETPSNAASRALITLAGICTGTSAGKIISHAHVPVTVVSFPGNHRGEEL